MVLKLLLGQSRVRGGVGGCRCDPGASVGARDDDATLDEARKS